MEKKIFEYFAHPVFKYKVEDYSNQNKILEKNKKYYRPIK